MEEILHQIYSALGGKTSAMLTSGPECTSSFALKCFVTSKKALYRLAFHVDCLLEERSSDAQVTPTTPQQQQQPQQQPQQPHIHSSVNEQEEERAASSSIVEPRLLHHQETVFSCSFSVASNKFDIRSKARCHSIESPRADAIIPKQGNANEIHQQEVWIRGQCFGVEPTTNKSQAADTDDVDVKAMPPPPGPTLESTVRVLFGNKVAQLLEVQPQRNLITVLAPRRSDLTETTTVEVVVQNIDPMTGGMRQAEIALEYTYQVDRSPSSLLPDFFLL